MLEEIYNTNTVKDIFKDNGFFTTFKTVNTDLFNSLFGETYNNVLADKYFLNKIGSFHFFENFENTENERENIINILILINGEIWQKIKNTFTIEYSLKGKAKTTIINLEKGETQTTGKESSINSKINAYDSSSLVNDTETQTTDNIESENNVNSESSESVIEDFSFKDRLKQNEFFYTQKIIDIIIDDFKKLFLLSY